MTGAATAISSANTQASAELERERALELLLLVALVLLHERLVDADPLQRDQRRRGDRHDAVQADLLGPEQARDDQPLDSATASTTSRNVALIATPRTVRRPSSSRENGRRSVTLILVCIAGGPDSLNARAAAVGRAAASPTGSGSTSSSWAAWSCSPASRSPCCCRCSRAGARCRAPTGCSRPTSSSTSPGSATPSEHGLIGNRFDLAPGDRPFLHPGFLLTGLVHRDHGHRRSRWVYMALWKPVAVGAAVRRARCATCAGCCPRAASATRA